MSGTLNVRTATQAALWRMELAGQISDGAWENARPFNHWEAWCAAEVRVNPDDPGRDFAVRRTTYNFADPDLLQVVGERMLRYGRLAKKYGVEVAVSLRDVLDLEGKLYEEEWVGGHAELEKSRGHQPYWAKKLEHVRKLDRRELESVMSDVSLYDWPNLLGDLRDLSRIVKIDRRKKAVA